MTAYDSSVRFDNSRPIAFGIARDVAEEGYDVVLVRDVLGRFTLIVEDDSKGVDAGQHDRWSATLHDRLGPYCGKRQILLKSRMFSADALLGSPRAIDVPDGSTSVGSVRFLDNTVVGESWTQVSTPSAPKIGPRTHRTALYGFKGGVGRTTATSVLARALADTGKIVLVIDLDLESPGIGPLLLGTGRLCRHGVVDHLVEAALGNEEGLEIVARSGYEPRNRGELWIAPARGAGDGTPNAYVDKLNRVYADSPGASFADRLEATVRACEEAVEKGDSGRRPDVVLLDSRAGIHDVAAVTISRLCDLALLFGADNAQTWSGYRDLFEAWAASGQGPDIRHKLRMVASMVPDSVHHPMEIYLRSFRLNSYDCFSTLYDEVMAEGTAEDSQPSDSGEGTTGSIPFAPSPEDDSAPHHPVPILFEPGLVGMNVPDSPQWQERVFVRAAYLEFLATVVPLVLADPVDGNDDEEETG
ncbi:KGGVGR-motif variant AAA ATPase [Streptomyces microflavus]|uniref:KGGVGR-motif variant AAA ATPase n=1 Tax=Streptomyces microflavus TaxID=1919 RepID=UPI0036AB806A